MGRTRYLCYRCVGCGKILTALQIERTWVRAERSGKESTSLCVCGGRQVRPTNPSLREELTNPFIWELWLRRVVFRDL